MLLYLGIFIFGMAVAYSEETEKTKTSIYNKLFKSLPWFLIWSICYFGILTLNKSGDIDINVKKGNIAKITEFNKVPLAGFSGNVVGIKSNVLSDLFGVNISINTKEYFEYMRLYKDGSVRLDKLPSNRVFVKEDAMPRTSYLARIKAMPKVSWMQHLFIVPPFFTLMYKSDYWVAHVPPDSVFCKFEVKLE